MNTYPKEVIRVIMSHKLENVIMFKLWSLLSKKSLKRTFKVKVISR